MDELVRTLSQGDHPVEFSLRPERTMQILNECLGRKYVHVRFTGTRGGTELGVRLDSEATDLSKCDLQTGKGWVHVEGTLTLNYVKVRCVADIDLATLKGQGHLVPLVEAAATPASA